MKQLISSAIGVVVLALVLVGSPARAAELGLGVLGGGNSTYFAGDTPSKGSFKSDRAHQVGGFVELGFGVNVLVSLQAMWQKKSPVLESTPDKSDPDFKIRSPFELEYITVPIMVQYAFGEKTTRFYLTTGGEVSMLQSATFSDEGGPATDITDLLEKTDVAVNAGLGVRSKLGPFNWFAELRYVLGLVDLADGDPIAYGKDFVTWKSRSSQLLLGVSIPLLGGGQ